jgi:hypothetical protein
MFVEGLLRELRVNRVAAGRLESAIATEGFDCVMGWEMLELSAVGHRMLPCAFQYTFAGPSSDVARANLDRLNMVHSDAVQFLMVGGPASDRPHLHGLDPFPDHLIQGLGHHFTRKNEGAKRKKDLGSKSKVPPQQKGQSHKELFQWAAATSQNRRWQLTDPRLKRAAASMVSPSFGTRKRDELDVDRDLSGFRRLALARHRSLLLHVEDSCYKDDDYEAHSDSEEGMDDLGEISLASLAQSPYTPAGDEGDREAKPGTAEGSFFASGAGSPASDMRLSSVGAGSPGVSRPSTGKRSSGLMQPSVGARGRRS